VRCDSGLLTTRTLAHLLPSDLGAALPAPCDRRPSRLAIAPMLKQRILRLRHDERCCPAVGTDICGDENQGHGGSLETSHYDVPGTNVGDHALGGRLGEGEPLRSRIGVQSRNSPGEVDR
jgi:hypothetical protein